MSAYALYISSLSAMTVKQLLLEVKDRGLSRYSKLNKTALIQLLKADTNRSQFERLEPLNYPLVADKVAQINRKYPVPKHVKQGFYKQGVFYHNRVISPTQGQGIAVR